MTLAGPYITQGRSPMQLSRWRWRLN
jgi:hypothetical protein